MAAAARRAQPGRRRTAAGHRSRHSPSPCRPGCASWPNSRPRSTRWNPKLPFELAIADQLAPVSKKPGRRRARGRAPGRARPSRPGCARSDWPRPWRRQRRRSPDNLADRAARPPRDWGARSPAGLRCGRPPSRRAVSSIVSAVIVPDRPPSMLVIVIDRFFGHSGRRDIVGGEPRVADVSQAQSETRTPAPCDIARICLGEGAGLVLGPVISGGPQYVDLAEPGR